MASMRQATLALLDGRFGDVEGLAPEAAELDPFHGCSSPDSIYPVSTAGHKNADSESHSL